MFVGVHERQLDERGRVALPPTFRHPLGDQCYLSSGDDGCIRVRSVDAFNEEAAELIEKVKRGEATRDRQRFFAASASIAAIDKQGRITIESSLRTYAGISPQSGVVVLGNLDHIEIWSPDAYTIRERSGRDDMTGEPVGATT